MEVHPKVADEIGYHTRIIMSFYRVNEILQKIEHILSTHGGWYYVNSNSISIHDASKATYDAIKSVLGLDEGKKAESSYRLSLEYMRNDIEIIFRWGIPDSCEVIYEEEEIPEDEIERTTKKFVGLKCDKPLLELVFPEADEVLEEIKQSGPDESPE